jgi:translation elongation factor EF-G
MTLNYNAVPFEMNENRYYQRPYVSQINSEKELMYFFINLMDRMMELFYQHQNQIGIK